jgi:hypothetical protein|tara:strand:+ start:1207 stop:1395 length:189 start_codon:yes stop_codon:yes gene_type:complete
MIKLEQKENESRKQYLVRLAIEYITEHTGYVGVDDYLYYDEAECDGYCLAEDLRIEFDIEED